MSFFCFPLSGLLFTTMVDVDFCIFPPEAGDLDKSPPRAIQQAHAFTLSSVVNQLQRPWWQPPLADCQLWAGQPPEGFPCTASLTSHWPGSYRALLAQGGTVAPPPSITRLRHRPHAVCPALWLRYVRLNECNSKVTCVLFHTHSVWQALFPCFLSGFPQSPQEAGVEYDPC